jgi:hypothetical protein
MHQDGLKISDVADDHMQHVIPIAADDIAKLWPTKS